ncbi:proteasome regulatory particle lid subunit RPN13 KNAG_0B06550 [Huiozyma naganishii CBS 8797]|uniref:Pru domain-containing protein n=1 Tax=Huiozyma naganishii (strain ATCC MYA-139 / BCRC 22969 / CBS 8797 / KCTC 17520 / NBRC 10181 / NCYC 3082 / Yp74L-3) TaxID=1071383 RepID=J7RVV4_HUIN7|nr:hypothetical protein KNAG_0B06550 [Kazachstania naganishii CBS 8797]CCK69082.1 hypothetical protein KNAG_0B06550 [Kazachstania naganishii CBS 8797]
MSDEIQFRAGMAQYDEASGLCTALPAQGRITMRPNDEEQSLGFWDFEWRPTGTTGEPIQLILIPGETHWVPLRSCKTGRVFCLVFSSNEKYFFWLQEKNKAGLAPGKWSPADLALYDRIKKLLAFADEDEDEDESEKKSSGDDDDAGNDSEKNNDVIMADAAA